MKEPGVARMADSAFAPIRELLPHRGRAVLLDRVLTHEPSKTVCAVDPFAGSLFRSRNGTTPAYVGLEYMAQTIAAHGALLERARHATGTIGEHGATADKPGHDAKPGFFVGARRLSLASPHFDAGQELTVTAVHLRGTSGLLAFDCTVADAATGSSMVSGVLTVYLLESFEALVEDFSADD